MFKPAIQQTWVLVTMAVLAVVLFYSASAIQVEHVAGDYDLKIKAAERMTHAMTILKNVRMAEAVFIDDVNDPNHTGLIGRQSSFITTDEGDLDSKISVLDPNVAAMMVQLLRQAGAQSGDTIAITMTGSMPGANLAVYCAIEELKLVPIIMSSLGASQWGANDENFTWLDMEKTLLDSGIISFHSSGASIGGGSDIGRRLSPLGRDLIQQAITRNNIPELEGVDLEDAIQLRMAFFASHLPLSHYKAYINVGGGAAALGSRLTDRLIPAGLTTRMDFDQFPTDGTLVQFGQKRVPILHVLNIREFFNLFGYPYAAVPPPAIGSSELYSSTRYSKTATAVALILIMGMVVGVGIKSKRMIRHHLQEHEPDSYV